MKVKTSEKTQRKQVDLIYPYIKYSPLYLLVSAVDVQVNVNVVNLIVLTWGKVGGLAGPADWTCRGFVWSDTA